MGLSQSGSVSAELGDGSSVILKTYTCLIECFGQEKKIEALANNGQHPLLGVELLRDYKLTIDYPSQTLTIQ